MRTRVVITGAGCVTSLGSEIEDLWGHLVKGDSGIARTTLFDASQFPTKISAEVRDWSLARVGEDPEPWAHRSRQTRFAVGAAKKAYELSQLDPASLDPTRVGVYLGCGEAYQDFGQFMQMVTKALQGERVDLARYIKAGLEILDPATEMAMQSDMAASFVASMFDAQGPNACCYTACAASSQAIGEATEIIRRGDADIMLAGGAHSLIHPFGVTGLNLLTALSTNNEEPTKASRPFDRDRDGFVMGEGAGIVVLERLEHALAQGGAHIYGELRGYGSAADAFRITDTHPEGRGAAACIERALTDAQLNPDDIDYINAHGTSTVINDKVETLAVKRVFGSQAYKTPISSTKSMTGHLLAAAGVIELITCLMCIRDGIVPPTINYHTPDEDCDLDYIPNEARDRHCDHVLSNSFGFGGQNVALVVSRLAA